MEKDKGPGGNDQVTYSQSKSGAGKNNPQGA
jgi:hypothetical protein